MLGAETHEILDKKFLNKKKQEDEALEKFYKECDFEEIKDGFHEGSLPNQLNFLHGGQSENFAHADNFISLNHDNREFIAFHFSYLTPEI